MAGNDRFVVGRIVELGDCTDAEKEQRLAKALKDATITSTSANCFDSESILKEADAILHRLWTWAVGMEGYDKAEWKRLEALIWKLGRPGETVNPKAEEDDDEEEETLEQGLARIRADPTRCHAMIPVYWGKTICAAGLNRNGDCLTCKRRKEWNECHGTNS